MVCMFAFSMYPMFIVSQGVWDNCRHPPGTMVPTFRISMIQFRVNVLFGCKRTSCNRYKSSPERPPVWSTPVHVDTRRCSGDVLNQRVTGAIHWTGSGAQKISGSCFYFLPVHRRFTFRLHLADHFLTLWQAQKFSDCLHRISGRLFHLIVPREPA